MDTERHVVDSEIDLSDLRDVIERFLAARVAERDRNLLRWRLYGNLTYEEISNLDGRSQTRIKNIVARYADELRNLVRRSIR